MSRTLRLLSLTLLVCILSISGFQRATAQTKRTPITNSTLPKLEKLFAIPEGTSHFSPDSNQIFSFTAKGYTRLDASTGAELGTQLLDPDTTSDKGIVFSRDGKYVTMAGNKLANDSQQPAQLITIATGERKPITVTYTSASKKVTQQPAYPLYFNADSTRLYVYSTGTEKGYHAWDVASGQSKFIIKEFTQGTTVQTIVTDYDALSDTFLVNRAGRPAIFEADTGKELSRIDMNAPQAIRSPDSKLLIIVNGRLFLIYDLATQKQRAQGQNAVPAKGEGTYGFRPDSKEAVVLTEASGIVFVDTASGTERDFKLPAQLGTFKPVRVRYSPDGAALILFDTAGQFVFVDRETGKLLTKAGGFPGNAAAFKISADGTRLMTAGAVYGVK